jgi:aminoglycoside phosphotransferase (APT) family kinase protein
MPDELYRSSVPEPEVSIDVALVSELLAAQHPDLTGLPLSLHAEGWDNVTFRCGTDLAVRLPRRRLGAEIIDTEIRWLPEIAPSLGVPVPASLRTGEPQGGYPWRWCVVPWIEGDEAGPFDLGAEGAAQLGDFLGRLHAISPPKDPPRNPFRGGPLEETATRALARIERIATHDDPLASHMTDLRHEYLAGLEVARDVPETWLHGDLHPRNVLVKHESIAGVLDWGDMCVGDPCTDLAAAWLFLDPADHDAVWERYEPSAATLARSRAWAVAYGAMLLEAGRGADPLLEAAGRAALQRLLG